jgi:hypothetical protein
MPIASLAVEGAPPAPIRELLMGADSSKTHSAEHPRLRGTTPAASSRVPAEIVSLLSRAGS